MSASAASPVIEVQGLTRVFRTYRKQPGLLGAVRGLWRRQYEETPAVRDVSFTVREGEFVGVLGPNGAGKTTTLKMLSGLLHPTGGTARVLGYTPWLRPMEYRRQFALLLGQKNQLWWDLPARESLELNGRIYGIPRREFESRVAELADRLRVTEQLDVMVRELSLGERMKLEIIAALLHQPKVLFLDEPTIGLDVVAQRTVREFLREHNERSRTTILLTSHNMVDIEALCPRVVIIDRGTLFFDGALHEVVEQFADAKLVTAEVARGSAFSAVELPAHGEVLEHTPNRLRLRVPREHAMAVCRDLLTQHPVADLNIQDIPAEEVIRNLFLRSGRPAVGGEDTTGFGVRAA